MVNILCYYNNNIICYVINILILLCYASHQCPWENLFFVEIGNWKLVCYNSFKTISSSFTVENHDAGTREVAVKKTKKELAEERKETEQAKKAAKQKNLLSFLQNVPQPGDNEEGSIEFSLAGLFRCMFCTYPKPIDEKQQLVRIAESLEVLEKRLEGLER